MEYFETPYQQHNLYHHEPMSSHYIDAHQNYAMAQRTAPMIAMPNPTRTNDTKPRLGKDEVDILEREFKKNPKPTTQTKRQFAEDMGVDLARINVGRVCVTSVLVTNRKQNWFQNRRAKRKQEKKQEAYEAGQAQEAMGYSEPSSPDFYNNNGYYSDTHLVSVPQQGSFSIMNNGPPQGVAPYNPQYSDPSSASMESLQRTLAAAQAASEHEEFQGFREHQESLDTFSLIHDYSHGDRAQFPSPDQTTAQFDGSQAYSYPSTYTGNMYSAAPQSMNELRSPDDPANHSSPPYSSYPNSGIPAFPSQLLPVQPSDGLASHSGSDCSQSPEASNESALRIAFKYENIPQSNESSMSPPGPSIPFKSPPPPMDIASRRKKVQVKPAALIADKLRGRPAMGPRTVSHAEGFRRLTESPASSPMRRIASAGGNRNVLSGRICKSGFESSQRSPINLGGFADASSFIEHNYQSIRHPPSLNGGSSHSSSLAPPTPMSPREREMSFVKREGPRSTASPVNGKVNFVFNAGTGCFTTIEADQNLASPPETPQAQMVINAPSNPWANSLEFPEKSWHFEVPDESLFTPAHDGFPLELHMPQPSYLSSMSQPVTPAFGAFNPSIIFGGSESPQFKHESPQYMLSTQTGSEYSFPDVHHYPVGMSPTMTTKQKQFQFSHTTAADFSEK
jgi:hypothetical protein